MSLSPEVFINRIETEVPPNEGHGKFLNFLPHLISDQRHLQLVNRLAQKSHIEKRYSVLRGSEKTQELDTDGFFVPGKFASTADRMARYQKEALPLAEKPVARILEYLKSQGLAKNSITHLIVTSCTGFYAPGLDLELQKRFELRSDLERSIIGFMGCYAGINGLKAAYHIVRSIPEANVVVVNLELCSLHLQDSGDPEKILGFLQFADGCAASLVSSRPQGLRLNRFRAEVVADRAELIRWNIGDSGFDMVLSPEVPKALASALPELLPRLMTAEERQKMKLWAIHPGGRSILDAVQAKLELTDNEMRPSRDVLKNFGNMSSATVLFVLRSILENPESEGLGAAMAFGPGITVESMLFTKL